MSFLSKSSRLLTAALLSVSLLLPQGPVTVRAADSQGASAGLAPAAAPAAPSTVAPGLDSYSYSFDDGTLQGWAPRGGVTLGLTSESVVSATYSLKTAGRTAAWHGPSLNVSGLLKKGAVYEISGYVKLPQHAGGPAGTVKLSMEQKPAGGTTGYITVASSSVTAADWIQLKGSYSFTQEMDGLTLYVESSDAAEDILIDDLAIQMVTPADNDQTGLSSDFEDGTPQGWAPRIGSEAVNAVTDTAHSGAYSLLTTAREGAYFGPKRSMLGKVHKDSKYKFSVWVKLAPGEAPAQLRLSLERGYQGTNSYDTIVGSTAVTADGWVQLTGDYQLRNTADTLDLYVESADGKASFYLDDFSLSYIAPIGIQKDIPNLYERYQADFPNGIGAAIEPFETEGQHGELLKKHFNAVVAGNVMKPDYTQPVEGTFTFENADRVVAFAKANGMKVRGHTLVWHSQTPSWFFKDADGREMTEETDPAKRQANKELLLKRMETHIKTVVEHFGTDVYGYDVVNEVIDDTQGLRNSKWYQIAGKDYIKEAFRYARKYAPAGTKLYINDYNTHSPRKAQELYNLVKELLEEGVPVDGVGHQTHIRIDSPSIAQIGASIEMFGKLGLDNQITELDVTVYGNDTDKYDPVPQELLVKQGYRYKELMAEFVRLKAYISSVVFWGMADDNTWLKTFPITRTDLPLLFDEQLQAKPAYWGLVDPSKLPVSIQQGDVAQGKPEIDGKADLVWSTQQPFELKGDPVGGTFRTLWHGDSLYVLGEIRDSSRSKGDMVELFIDDNHAKTPAYEADDKHYVLKRSGKPDPRVKFKVKEVEGGYRFEAKVPITKGAVGVKKGFDIRVTDADTAGVVSWNDSTRSQDTDTSKFGSLTLAKAVSVQSVTKGTPVIDGKKDRIWNSAKNVSTGVWVQGTGGAAGRAKLLWDEGHLYVWAEVEDALLSDASAQAHQQDSIELFLDPNHHRSAVYEPDDGQFRVNFKNVLSFGGAASAEKISSRVTPVPGGYIVEAALALPDAARGRVIGFDFQVNNDGDGDGTRDTVAVWNDPSGLSYTNTSKFGALQLVTH
ncbi:MULTISPECIES: endo-1,4-beta-xylanase [Paenibacillus]|uniref:endo-1,4-beta-xylanase n=1 Tax=Paenibacillus TaxID=44249 RepID=UPI0022B85B9A|nr:endo-1,4-beta-xylanase [Paenibacillus caseinilyticus]MCZ8520854.1 endo-1,4-beta-xylanase [Paenibacillus caseinilyticus]